MNEIQFFFKIMSREFCTPYLLKFVIFNLVMIFILSFFFTGLQIVFNNMRVLKKKIGASIVMSIYLVVSVYWVWVFRETRVSWLPGLICGELFIIKIMYERIRRYNKQSQYPG